MKPRWELYIYTCYLWRLSMFNRVAWWTLLQYWIQRNAVWRRLIPYNKLEDYKLCVCSIWRIRSQRGSCRSIWLTCPAVKGRLWSWIPNCLREYLKVDCLDLCICWEKKFPVQQPMVRRWASMRRLHLLVSSCRNGSTTTRVEPKEQEGGDLNIHPSVQVLTSRSP